LFTFSAWKLTVRQNENKDGHSTDRLARLVFRSEEEAEVAEWQSRKHFLMNGRAQVSA